MKRSRLHRRTPLRRHRKLLPVDPARARWKQATRGYCESCSKPCWRLERHHVVYLQHVRLEGGECWDLANSMLVCEECHWQHHRGKRRIRTARLPESAVAFARRLFGAERALAYLLRYYA